jgi:translocation and assembly module TamB
LSRWWWRLLFWPLVALLVVLASIPFTEPGARTLVAAADQLLPLEIQYGGGTLAGRLHLTRLAWISPDVRVEVQDLVAELSPACLWYSKICFSQLQARQLDIVLPPAAEETPPTAAESTAAESTAASEMVVFPVRIEANSLLVENTLVQWDGGQWRQGSLNGAVVLRGSTVLVSSATVHDAHLELHDPAPDEPPSADAIELPGIDLPLKLLVDRLQLEQPSWDIYGQTRQWQVLTLRGSWRRVELRLEQLDIRADELGELSLRGALDFAANWPLELDTRAVFANVPGWPAVLEPAGSLRLQGDLKALEFELGIAGAVSLSAAGSLDALDRDLPFSLSLQGDWDEALALTEHVQLPAALQELVLEAPLQLDVSGSLQEQVFQLRGTASGLGYQDLAVQVAGRLRDDTLVVEDMRLQDAGGDNTVWGLGKLSFGDQLHWSAELESNGFNLPELHQYARGNLAGHLHASGSSAGQDWQLAVDQVELHGMVNGLPAHISGHGGLGQGLLLSASDLQAEINGARLSLQAPGISTAPARLQITVPELGRWQRDTRGSLSLQATLAPDWKQLAFTGSLQQIQWAGLAVDSGEIEGVYRPDRARSSTVEVNLVELTLAGVELTSLRLIGDTAGSSQTLSLRSSGDLEGELLLSGSFDKGSDWVGTLAPAEVRAPHGGWKLDEPVALSWSGSSAALRVAAHCWKNPQTQICPGELIVGQQGSGSLEISGGMEFLASLFPEEVEVRGELKSNLAASWGEASGLVLEGNLETRDVLVTRYYGVGESASVNWDLSRAEIRQGEHGLQLSVQMHREGRRAIDLEALLPTSREGPLVGRLDFEGLRLATLAPFATNLATLEGQLTGQLQLQGTIDHPQALGAVKLTDGRFAVVGNPTELQNLEVMFDARGDWAKVSGSGSLGGGVLQINGALHASPELRVELSMSGEKHELLWPPSTQMIVSEQLELVLTGKLLDLEGEIIVHEGVLQHEQLPAGSVALSQDVVEVDYSGNVIRQSHAFDTRVDINLLIEDNFKIVGDMVNATVGGELRLLQPRGQPLQVFGNLKVIGGELRAYQQILRVKRGTIAFSGTPDNPEFDVRAERQISGSQVVVGVQLRGTMSQPKLEIFSDPVMPQGETMSYLLRGRGLDSGASADGLAMALSLGSGAINQTALVTELNRIPGISNVAFGAEGTDEDTAATVGGYIGNRLYLSYGMGLYEPVNVLTARLYLQTRLWLEVVSRLENSLDLYYSFDIK